MDSKTNSACKNHNDIKVYSKGLCRKCYEINLKKINPEYHERQKQNSRKWHNENKERKSILDKEYRKKNPQDKIAKRKSWLKRKYNITLEFFDNLLLLQKNCCAICEQKLKNGDRFLHIDHCHKTGKVRGILCSQCNWFMSKIDNVENCFKNLNNYIKNKGTVWQLEDTQAEK